VDGVRIGVAPGITDVVIGKVIPDMGSGTAAMLYDGLLWAWREQRANIISISFGLQLARKTSTARS
jgi:hypothetical protein